MSKLTDPYYAPAAWGIAIFLIALTNFTGWGALAMAALIALIVHLDLKQDQ